MKRLLLFVFLAILALASAAGATSLGEIVQSVYHRGVYFDQDRFDTLVIRDFVNDAAGLIATIGKTNQTSTAIALTSVYGYELPADFYQVEAAVLNANRLGDPTDPINKPRVLLYEPMNQYGKNWSPDAGRPQSYSIWDDSLFVNRVTYTGVDTIFVRYFATPTPVVDTADTIDLPSENIPLLKEVVLQMCIDRIVFPGRSTQQEALALTSMIREALYGREADHP